MYPHPYLQQLIAEEHAKDMRSAAAAANLAHQARRGRRGRSAPRHAAAVPGASSSLLHMIPRPRKPVEETTHRAA
jgi:hypothetical protein